MKRLQPVIWSKGTLLTPQHLQVQDRYFEDVLSFQINALRFEPWGFKELRIERDDLGKGVLVISRASGIFPDGLLFDIPDSDAALQGKQLRDYLQGNRTDIIIHLTVPQHREAGINVASVADNVTSRYISDSVTVRDETNGSSTKRIHIGRKNFRLLADTEIQQGTSSLPVARITKTKQGFELDPYFVPPLIDITASPYLMTITRRLLEIVTSKSANLSGMRRERNETLVDFGVSDIANFWLLYSLNTHTPILRHLFNGAKDPNTGETQRTHPERLFRAMLSLASALTTFSLQIQPRDLPLYDHSHLGICMKELDEKLRFLLEKVIPSNYISLPLRKVRDFFYETAIDHDAYFENTRWFLSISAQIPEADLIRKSADLIKVDSADEIGKRIALGRSSGLKLKQTTPPSSIPIKLNRQYFGLSLTGDAWDNITRSRNVSVYVPNGIPDPELELVILLPEPI